MKIIHVSDYGETRPNGIYSSVHALAQEQRRLGHHVIECTVWNTLVVDDKNVFYTGKKKQFVSIVDAHQPDIVVFNGLYPKQQISFSHYIRRKKIPYILVFHGGASFDNAKKHWFRKIVANILFWYRIIYKAEKVIYLNENELSKSVFKKTNSHYAIIPNGTVCKEVLKKHKSDGLMNISFISRLDYFGKGIDILIRAIQILKEQGWNNKLHFSFYGTSEDDTDKKICALGDIVSCHGFVTGKEKEEAYKHSDLFILPSRSEGMPMCVLEALSYGVPCLLTRQTNMVDIVVKNNCGWEISLSSENIAEMITIVYDEVMNKKGEYFERCRGLAKQYSWESVAVRFLKLYDNVVISYYGKR